ncbi:hypothetical protein LAZ67_2002891 [Cordylochernes scorpioides]|uniref:Uncharacterized protein n=1 Tax=Cordylochernes scorpioides TaxID=51811 RepID=A0ABY6K407_9ARAC|nr:hypothetical protein LAZ67_2002891 [Cordylochernes scorpioides]
MCTDKKYRLPSLSSALHRPTSGQSQQSILLHDLCGQEGSTTNLSKPKAKSKKFMFPWWCRYIAWFLCFASVVVSVFFLWAYGIQFGDEKTRKWLTSLLISFFSSILVTQPIKTKESFGIAVVASRVSSTTYVRPQE